MCSAADSCLTDTLCHRKLHGAGTLEGTTYKKYLELNTYPQKATHTELVLEKKHTEYYESIANPH